ncbi:MAG: hypothetical protein QOI25_4604, partial [Mycobacterium sp.]|nr:hypothetical protein [Mycobacterium sp.]
LRLDVHFMDHPDLAIDDPTGRSLYDTDRDIVLGHEFVGEVIGHGPGCTEQFPIGTRVTSIPIRLVNGGVDGTRIIGQHPESQGSFGELLVIAEMLAKQVEGDVSLDAAALTDAFAVGEFYVCTVPLQLCHHFAQPMVARGTGGIVVLGSGAGFAGAPNMVAYAATKAFDMVFAEALWSELNGKGVDVLGLILGKTDTPALRRLKPNWGRRRPPISRWPMPPRSTRWSPTPSATSATGRRGSSARTCAPPCK